MKRVALIALALATAPLASAELYKYIDKDGKTVYSDQPSATGESRQLNAPPPAPAAAPKSATERDKELQKGRDEAKERAKKAESAEKLARAKEQACATATSNYRAYTGEGRFTKFDEKGERVFMEDSEIDSARERSKREMDEACKK